MHELRAHINAQFSRKEGEQPLLLSTMSFGFKNGVPPEADLVFDVRFLPNPHFIPEFRPLTGRDPAVADYVMSFPQTTEFLDRTADMLLFLLPHYVKEGKSYLTIAFGCTGGQHRSVAIAETIKKRLSDAGYRAKGVAPGHAALISFSRFGLRLSGIAFVAVSCVALLLSCPRRLSSCSSRPSSCSSVCRSAPPRLTSCSSPSVALLSSRL